MFGIKTKIKTFLGTFCLTKDYMYGRYLFNFYNNSNSISKRNFLCNHHFYVQPSEKSKAAQIAKLIDKVEICPVQNNTFFYSIDCFKTVALKNHIFDNYSVDYTDIVCSSFKEIKNKLIKSNSVYAKNEIMIIEALAHYYKRCLENEQIIRQYKEQLVGIGSLFERPAESFFEGLQRILFFNQFLWQTRHKHNGFGHLDWILYDLYKNDLKRGKITEDSAKNMIKEFFMVLHENCWFKSTMLLGDTGQIIVLGGLEEHGEYKCNELTYLFISASKELKLPEPKVLLRCSKKMPDDLLELAIDCLTTGIGAPFLSNDDVVIPALIEFGYHKEDAYKYVTSACWEPLISNDSCDQNNIQSINFAYPFIEMLNDTKFEECKSVEEILKAYKSFLAEYVKNILNNLSKIEFEEDPLFSILSNSSRKREKDIVRGGAVYNNLGLTSVGMGTVVNSLINIKKYVFEQKKYSLMELNKFRKNNFDNNENIVVELGRIDDGYGTDSKDSIELTTQIIEMVSAEFEKYRTRLGGKFKFGLSSPNYIVDANNTSATFDGRKNGDPFLVHISSKNPKSITELISFAMKLDYKGNQLNGNVVDFIVTPKLLQNNKKKFMTLFRTAFGHGVFQLQMNVVDSKTLIAAKQDPDLFPNLIVRVWGFSAYFNDLPEEYKNLLIERAMESEQVA